MVFYDKVEHIVDKVRWLQLAVEDWLEKHIHWSQSNANTQDGSGGGGQGNCKTSDRVTYHLDWPSRQLECIILSSKIFLNQGPPHFYWLKWKYSIKEYMRRKKKPAGETTKATLTRLHQTSNRKNNAVSWSNIWIFDREMANKGQTSTSRNKALKEAARARQKFNRAWNTRQKDPSSVLLTVLVICCRKLDLNTFY